jgi:hypothetical protein
MRPHTSAYVRCSRSGGTHWFFEAERAQAADLDTACAYVSMYQHASAYVSIRQHTSAYADLDALKHNVSVFLL